MKFRGKLLLGGKTATGIVVPADVVEGLGSGKRPAVRVTINGRHTYRNTIAPYNGQFMLSVSAEQRAAAGVAAGDELDVDVELDTEPRTVTVPADFEEALKRVTPPRSVTSTACRTATSRGCSWPLRLPKLRTPASGASLNSGHAPRRPGAVGSAPRLGDW